MQQIQYTVQPSQPVSQVQQVSMQYPNQAPVMIVTQATPQSSNDDKFKAYAKKQIKVLSAIQITMGILCVIFGIVITSLKSPSPYYTYSTHFPANIGYGIWNGIFFILVGGIGLGAAKNNTGGWIIGTMILNIICSVTWCISLITFTSVGLIIASVYAEYSCFGSCIGAKVEVFNALDSLMLIMALAQFVITIWCAALCCGAVCRCCKNSTNQPVLMYNTAAGTNLSPYPIVQQVHAQPGGQPQAQFVGQPVGQVHNPMVSQQSHFGGYSHNPPSYTSIAPGVQSYPAQGVSGTLEVYETPVTTKALAEEQEHTYEKI